MGNLISLLMRITAAVVKTEIKKLINVKLKGIMLRRQRVQTSIICFKNHYLLLTFYITLHYILFYLMQVNLENF